MILTDYYKYERLQGQKSKSRLDCTASTKSYSDFELKSFVYICENSHTKAGIKRKSDLSLTSGAGKHITSIYKPDLERGFAYGDVQGTTDLLLFVTTNFSIAADGTISEGATVEIFICRGKKFDKNAVFNLLTDGELNNEIAQIKATVTKSVTQKNE